MRARAWKAVIAILLILLIASQAIAYASKGLSNGSEERPRNSEKNNVNKSQMLEKAKRELENAKNLIRKAEKILSKCNNSECLTSFPMDVMKDIERDLRKAELMLKKDPSRSIALSKHVQALAKILISDLTRRLKARSRIEEKHEQIEESLKALKMKVKNLLEKSGSLSKKGNNSKVERVLIQVFKLVRSRRSLAETVKKLNTSQASIKKSEALKNSEEGESSSDDNLQPITHTLKSRQFSIEVLNVSMSWASIIEVENESLIRESMIDSGENVIVALSKKSAVGNELKMVMEVNQSLIGAIVNVTASNLTLTRTCEEVEIKLMELDRARLRFSVQAPERTCRKIFLIRFDPEIFGVNKLERVKVYVNGSEAILALSLLDLASGVYDEPAYIFTTSSEGVSVLIYVPHFSSYIIDVIAVFEHASNLRAALMRILTRETFVIATVTATIIFTISTLLHVRRIASQKA